MGPMVQLAPSDLFLFMADLRGTLSFTAFRLSEGYTTVRFSWSSPHIGEALVKTFLLSPTGFQKRKPPHNLAMVFLIQEKIPD